MRVPKFLDNAVDLIRKPLLAAALIAAPFLASGQNTQQQKDTTDTKAKHGFWVKTANGYIFNETAQIPDINNYDPNKRLQQTLDDKENKKMMHARERAIKEDPYFFRAPDKDVVFAKVDSTTDLWMTYNEDQNRLLFYRHEPVYVAGANTLSRSDKPSRHLKKALKNGSMDNYATIEMLKTINKVDFNAKRSKAAFMLDPRTSGSIEWGMNSSYASRKDEFFLSPGLQPNESDRKPTPDLNGKYIGLKGRKSIPFMNLVLPPNTSKFFFIEAGYRFYFDEPNYFGATFTQSATPPYAPHQISSAHYEYKHVNSRSRGAVGVGTPAEWPITLNAKLGVEAIGSSDNFIEYSNPYYEVEAGVNLSLAQLTGQKKGKHPLLDMMMLGVTATRGQVKRNEWNWGIWNNKEKDTFYDGLNVSLSLRPGVPFKHKKFTPQ